MATLNTLRTKYGIVLSVLIALVLVAFILGDQLSMRGNAGEMPEDKVVMTIDGKEILASEYAEVRSNISEMTRENIIRNMTYQLMIYRGMSEAEASKVASAMADEQIASIAASTFLYREYLKEAAEKAGIAISEAELNAAAKSFGQERAAAYMQQGYTAEQINNAVQYEWTANLLTAPQQMTTEKISALAAAGAYINRLEVEANLRQENLTFDGRYVAVPYTTIEDMEVSEAEVDAYYMAHRKENANYNARSLRYVTFEIAATDEDKAAIEKMVKDVDAQVSEAKGDSDKIKLAVRSIGGKADTYKTFESLTAEVKEAVKRGKKYGPALVNDAWTASYVISDVTAPASYEFDVVETANIIEAQALVETLKANDGDFTKLETAVDKKSDSREMIAMSESEAEKFINKKVGDIFTYTYNHKPAVLKITKLGDKARFVLLAEVNKPVIASQETNRTIANNVDKFVAAAGNSMESFTAAANEAGYQVLATTANRNDAPQGMTRGLRGIDNSRNLATWAYAAKVGAVKTHHDQDKIYVVMVTSIDNEKYEAKNVRSIENNIKRDKKYEIIASSLTMDNVAEGAKSGKFSDVKFSDNAVDGNYDAALVGAIAGSRETGVETKVKGRNAAYIFVVDAINGEVEPAAIEAERTPLMTQRKEEAKSAVLEALTEKADIEDFRGESEM